MENQINSHLSESIDFEEQKRIDAFWAEEAERRYKEIEDGSVTPIPGDEVMNRMNNRPQKGTKSTKQPR